MNTNTELELTRVIERQRREIELALLARALDAGVGGFSAAFDFGCGQVVNSGNQSHPQGPTPHTVVSSTSPAASDLAGGERSPQAIPCKEVKEVAPPPANPNAGVFDLVHVYPRGRWL